MIICSEHAWRDHAPCPACAARKKKDYLSEQAPGETKAPPSALQVGGTHYKDMAIQPSEFSQRNELNWCEANVVKYVCRHRNKNGRQDVEKAIHYLQLLLEWEYGGA